MDGDGGRTTTHRPHLRVGVIAPPYYELPPAAYGGIERVCHALAEALVDRGHDVTLVGAGASTTRARFVATFPEPQPEGSPDDTAITFLHAIRAAEALATLQVDVVHDHTLVSHLAQTIWRAPTLLTVHAALTGPDNYADLVAAVARHTAIAAVSHRQVHQSPHLDWAGCVHNGLLLDETPFGEDKDEHVVYLGRFNPNKGVHLCIDAAQRAGVPLVLAGTWTSAFERAYFDADIRPRLGRGVEWIGPVGDAEKFELLASARCLLLPLQWEEPFGLVVIEALACGTPVVALAGGAITELVADGRTGIICTSVGELPDAIGRAAALSAHACRADALGRFSAARMAAGYEALYAEVIAGRTGSRACAPAQDDD